MSRAHLHFLIALLGAALLAIGCGPRAPKAAFGSGPIITAPSTPEVANLERQMHARLNRDRAKLGLGPLAFDSKLADMARAHSKDMHEGGFFAHDSKRTGSLQDRLDRAGLLVKAARENIGEGASVDDTEDALLKSPGHHANIMATDVSHVGIGIVKVGSGSQQRLLVTQVFATPISDEDPAAARGAVAARVAEARRKAGLRPLPAHPLLEKLAKEHVDEVADDLDKSASAKIGDEVTRKLEGSGLKSVTVATSVFITADIYEPSGALLSSDARALGIATAAAKDERGRPAIKVLLLVGY